LLKKLEAKYYYNLITRLKNIIASQILDKIKAYHNNIRKEQTGGSQLQKLNEGSRITRQSQKFKGKTQVNALFLLKQLLVGCTIGLK